MSEENEKEVFEEAVKENVTEAIDALAAEPAPVFDHVMIDLETFSTKVTAAVLSIGAIEFDPETGDTGREFYERVDWDTAMAQSSVDTATVKWWMSQSDAARAEIIKDGLPLPYVLQQLAGWLGTDKIVWGNGSTFDITILQIAFGNNNMETPWKHWNVRDVRTIVDIAKGIVERPSMPEDTAHHALEDARHQAEYISSMWSTLRAGATNGIGGTNPELEVTIHKTTAMGPTETLGGCNTGDGSCTACSDSCTCSR